MESHLGASRHPRSAKLFLLCIASLLATVFFLNRAQHFASLGQKNTINSPMPIPSSHPASPSDQELLKCLSPEKVQELVEQKLELVYEEWVPATRLRWCRYLDVESQDLAPTQLEYKLSDIDAEKSFQAHQDAVQNVPTVHQLSDFGNAFALVNPVKELHQVQFFVREDPKYLEMTFSPANLNESQMMEKGAKVIKTVLEK
jgi:hypothetical protein